MGQQLKILLTGITGQVGWELQRSLLPLGEIIPVDRRAIDLSDPDSIRSAIRQFQPHLIVNPAAYTAVDKAESELDLAMAINGIAPGIMAEEALKIGAGIIHFSTDYVFSGDRDTPYRETDPTAPLGIYGKTKLEGEIAIQSSGVPHLILRTSWVYSRMGKNFLLTILRLARERSELRIVSDQIGAPTWSRAIAEATAQILSQGARNLHEFLHDRSGIYHLSACGVTSWHGFAQAILEADPQRSEQTVTAVLPINTSDYPTPAKRPAYSLLDNTKLHDTFGLKLPDWKQSLQLAIAHT
ncbi:dTDP-4-dehydrorhamnose reductase [Pseudanabaena sp. PCC 6802]|uniref:dTDP-4-dehydrorhamnose reductase n=1 Tax=Pseudanabaena sp. PCC 6802 TaxID=118173 RepID=UPI00034A8521|nr:dTDP-4-dehydrorhamnose reductase [Pseudanabaena sp. PCC 6802]